MGVNAAALSSPAGGAAVEKEAPPAQEFAELVQTHQRRIYRILMGFVRDPDEADTLTQECFLRAYRSWGHFRGECSMSTWLTRIAINLARDAARNRRRGFWRRLLSLHAEREDSPAIDTPGRGASPEQALLAREELEAVWEAVHRLPEQQKTVFFLRFVEEMPLEEIAETLEIETGTVKSHLSRAVNALRKKRWG
ncbi:MAG TPA: sigma-70 family RNA polymerase sigma factor [Terriglobales bacterium]|jgi:RNA polymerase sigma-70 factor (ECF subfamily)|nr:sigma-70 family RNA polymerase sigma factor [Terriglobales bacterium]